MDFVYVLSMVGPARKGAEPSILAVAAKLETAMEYAEFLYGSSLSWKDTPPVDSRWYATDAGYSFEIVKSGLL